MTLFKIIIESLLAIAIIIYIIQMTKFAAYILADYKKFLEEYKRDLDPEMKAEKAFQNFIHILTIIAANYLVFILLLIHISELLKK